MIVESPAVFSSQSYDCSSQGLPQGLHPNVYSAFRQLSFLLYHHGDDAETARLAQLAKEKIPGYDRHTLSFLCIPGNLFRHYLNAENEDDALFVTNPNIDINRFEGPVTLFGDQPAIINYRLNRARSHEGIIVLDTDSYTITHNGLFIPPTNPGRLRKEFKVRDDIELIRAVGYPLDYPLESWPSEVKPPEIGTKTKAMLSYSMKHPEVAFIRMNEHCYIIHGGRVVYTEKRSAPGYAPAAEQKQQQQPVVLPA